MFHLMTHAFFKALLFLAAGIVIHALAGEQDIRKMGGLRKLMPRTYLAFLIGALALVGIPPFAGFFSKDSILAAALAHGWYGEILWVAGMVGTFLTGLYTFRMLFIVFGGEPSAFVREHFHGTATADKGVGPLDDPDRWRARRAGGDRRLPPVRGRLDAGLRLARAGGAAARRGERDAGGALERARGAARARRDRGRLVDLRRAPRPVPRAAPPALLEHKFYFDELYDLVFYRPAVLLAPGLAARRGAARSRLGHRHRGGAQLGLGGRRAPPDRARPHLRARARGRARRPRRRLRGGDAR